MKRQSVLAALIAVVMCAVVCADGGKTKIVVIGVDGATWRVITPLMEKGEMPNLKKLMGRGVCGTIETLHDQVSPVIWTSVATGKVPEKHNIKSFLYNDDRGMEARILGRSNMRTAKAVWNIVSENKKRVGVHNWWVTYPAERVNGYVVTDLYQIRPYDLHVDTALVYPSSLELPTIGYKEFQGRFDAPERFYWDGNRLLFLDTTYSIFLKRHDETDLFMTYTHATDRVQHRFWRYMRPDECFPDDSLCLDERQRTLFADAIPKMYRAVDRWVGELMDNTDENSIVIVLSDHGAQALGKPQLYPYVDRILEAYGLSGNTVLSREGNSVHYLRNERRAEEIKELFSGITSPDGTPLYTVTDSDREGFNVKLVQQEVNSFDIVVRSKKYNLVKEGFCSHYELERSCGHDCNDGIFIMAGKGIRQAGRISRVSVLDITPTILYLLGLPVGRDMDGTVAVEAIEKSRLDAQPVSFIESYENKERQVGNPARKTNAAEEELKQRLRSLGYIQ